MLGKLRKDIYGTHMTFMLILQLVSIAVYVQYFLILLTKFCCQRCRKSK